jgi:hypothetical protein
MALVSATEAVSTDHWIGIIAADMDEESAVRLYNRIWDRDDDLSALGLTVLWSQLCVDCFGVDDTAAGRLAASYLHGNFLFRTWAFRQGMRINRFTVYDVLTAVYGWLIDGCEKPEDVDSMNRKIFRVSDPWTAK